MGSLDAIAQVRLYGYRFRRISIAHPSLAVAGEGLYWTLMNRPMGRSLDQYLAVI